MSSEIETYTQFVLYCCLLNSDDEYVVKKSSMAKFSATELSDKTMTQCLQYFGGYDYIEDYKKARIFRDNCIGTIGGGTSEIMREIIAKMVIDDVSYKEASKNNSNNNTINKTSNIMSNLENILGAMQAKAQEVKPLNNTIKFDFGEEQLFIDGTGEKNMVSLDNKDADCQVNLSFEDFIALTNGELNAIGAVMSGKVKIKGDMSVAMKLQNLFG